MKPRRTWLMAACCLCSLASGPAMAADAYPDRPVTIVVPSVAGGAADAVARTVAQGLSKRLDATVVVDNKPGAGSTLGASHVAKSKPDGYTLLLGIDATFASAPYLMPVQPFRPVEDFQPIGTLAVFPYVLVASPSAPFQSAAQLVEMARAQPGQYTYASGGEGSIHHLIMDAFQKSAQIQLRHVPYKAAPQGFIDMMGGHVDLMFIAPGTGAGPIKSHKIKGLAQSGSKVLADLPEIPLLKDSPISRNFVFESWFGLFARKGTPAEVIQRLDRALSEVMNSAEVKNQLTAQGITPRFEPATALAKRVEDDTRRFAPVVSQLRKQSDQGAQR
ncbi:MAG: tripartite tricarboxylate transporter substrate binding protein [Ottowia sp.]|uniref:Bug family tripartite tricarboxylate transporter substrate binding protein n=1 Tax=Ottowia sp. TaxID=1898956 RepID=UPI003C71B67F